MGSEWSTYEARMKEKKSAYKILVANLMVRTIKKTES
jgi:hypothetical protein